MTEPNLEGRTAYCGAGAWKNGRRLPGHAPRPSSPDLAFFEYCGDGSRRAEEHCARCGFYKSIHCETNPHTGRPGVTDHEFVRRGDQGFDSYYCGHSGWD